MVPGNVAIIDYGVGNCASIINALRNLNISWRLANTPADVEHADQIILPGVGSFPEAMNNLEKDNLIEPLRYAAKKNKRILGICLGMQLLAESSEELKKTRGLGLLPGKIRSFKELHFHTGWNKLFWEIPLKGNALKKSQTYYFNHSFIFDGCRENVIAFSRSLEYFPSIVKKNKIIGIQFHPEKSQEGGQVLLKKILGGYFDG